MALTQVSSGGIKDSEVKNADMADDSVGIAELSATGTAGNTTYLRGDNTWTVPPDTNTTYTHPNHSGEVTSAGDGATTITDDVVDEANLKISNAGSDGQYLQKQSGNTGGLTWATVTAGGGGATGTDYNDNVKVRWGTGNDLEIYHDGSDSKIVDSGTGTLNVHSSGFNLLNVAGNENFATFTNNGSVELYYDNSLKFKTNNAGAIYYGTLNTSDTGKATYGDGDDLEIYHSGTDTFIVNDTGEFKIRGDTLRLQSAGGEDYLYGAANGAVNLYHNSIKTFETTSTGVKVVGPEGGMAEILMWADEGDDDADKFRIIIDNSAPDFYIQNYKNGSSWENSLRLVADGAAEIFHDGVKKFDTVTGGARIFGYLSMQGTGGHIYLPDSAELKVGSGEDLKIYNDSGGNSYITESGSGSLVIKAEDFYVQNSSSATGLLVQANGDVEIPNGGLILSEADQGINFSGGTFAAGKTSSVLDDYEEGTFDASVSVDSGTGTYSYRSLKYIKIGHLCTVMGSVDMAFSVSDPGRVDIGGFPFAMVNAHEDVGFMCPAYNTTAAAGCDAGTRRFSMYAASSHIRMYANNYVSDGEIGTTNRVQFHISFTYPTS